MTAALRTSGFHHHAIKVRDLAAAEAFYVGVLGLAVERRWTYAEGSGEQGLRSLWLRTEPGSPEGFLALERASEGARGKMATATATATATSSPVDAADGGHFLLALRIQGAEREQWRRHLAAAGHPVSHETAFTLYVSDPEGNRLGLSHYPAPVDEASSEASSGTEPTRT